MAEARCGVRYISKERSGCPRWSCSGNGATIKKASAVSSASRYVGLTSSTRNTRSSEARMKAPATNPVRNGYRTISTLHWSSTSFGYINPSISVVSLANRAIQAVVKHLRSCGEMRFENLHIVGLQKRMDWIFGILQVNQLSGAGWAHFTTCGRQTSCDPVVAQRALIGGVLSGMKEAATVGTSLDAVAASQAIVVIDQHYTIRRVESSAHGTDLRAG